MRVSLKQAMWAGVAAVVVLGVCRAARFRYQDKEEAIFKSCREELQKLGLTRGAAKSKYPTPEIRMEGAPSCVLPGATGQVVIRGKFAPGTKFVLENDNLEVVTETVTPTEYRATVKAAAGIGPQTAGVLAITPVTGLTARQSDAVIVGGRYEWTMEAKNGWRVVARASGTNACATAGGTGLPYDVLFYKGGEANPFEKRSARLYYNMYERTNYRFTVEQQSADPVMQEYQTLMQKMADRNLTTAQRQQLMQKLQGMAEQMQKHMQAMVDPANIKKEEEKRKQFGCQHIALSLEGGSFTGELQCAQAVGTRIGVAGTIKPM